MVYHAHKEPCMEDQSKQVDDPSTEQQWTLSAMTSKHKMAADSVDTCTEAIGRDGDSLC